MKFLNTDAIHESGTLLYNKPVKENFKITTAPCPVFKNGTYIEFENYAKYKETIDGTEKDHSFNFQKVEFYYEPNIDTKNITDYPTADDFNSEDGILVKVYKLIGIIGTNLFGEQNAESNISQLCLYRAFEITNADATLDKDKYNITYYLYSYYSKGNLDYSKRYYLGETIPSGKYEVSYSSLTLNDKAIKGEAVKVDPKDIDYPTKTENSKEIILRTYPVFGHSTNCAPGKYYELKIYESDNECPIYLPMQEDTVDVQEGTVDGKSTNQLVVNVNYSDASVFIDDVDKYCHTINNLDNWSTQSYCMYNTIHGYTTDIKNNANLQTIKYFPVTNNETINSFNLGRVKHDSLKTGINNFENTVSIPNISDGYKVSDNDYVDEVTFDNSFDLVKSAEYTEERDVGDTVVIDETNPGWHISNSNSSVKLNKNELYKFTATLTINDNELKTELDGNNIFDIKFVLLLDYGDNVLTSLIEFNNNCLKSNIGGSDLYTINIEKYFTAPASQATTGAKLVCSQLIYKYINTSDTAVTVKSQLNTGFTITGIKLYKLTPKNSTLAGTFYTKYAYNTDTYIGQDTFTLYDNDIQDSEVYREWYYYLDGPKFESNYTNIKITPLNTNGTLTCTVSPTKWIDGTKTTAEEILTNNIYKKTCEFTAIVKFPDERIKTFTYTWESDNTDLVDILTNPNKANESIEITRNLHNETHLKGGTIEISCTAVIPKANYGFTKSATSASVITWDKVPSSIVITSDSGNQITNGATLYLGQTYTNKYTIKSVYTISKVIDNLNANGTKNNDTWAENNTYKYSIKFTPYDIDDGYSYTVSATDSQSVKNELQYTNITIKKPTLQITTNLSTTTYEYIKTNNKLLSANDYLLDPSKPGQTLKLSIIASFKETTYPGSITYQWKRSSDKKTWTNISDATNSNTYIIDYNTCIVGTYYYKCTISNRYAVTPEIDSNVATVNVKEITNHIVTYDFDTSIGGHGKKFKSYYYNISDNEAYYVIPIDNSKIIQDAIDTAADLVEKVNEPTEVWIKAGTYTPRASLTMKNNVAIYGGFAGTETSKDQRVSGNNTILDGDGKYRVFNNNYTNDNRLTNRAKLDNVTIRNGKTSDSGGGMYNKYASPEITNCMFTNNQASSNGGAIYNDNSSPIINTCTFESNKALNSGGAYGDGGAILNGNNSKLILTDCKFNTNSATDTGGAIANHQGSSLQLNYCTFNGNTAYSGGAIENWTNNSSETTLTANYCYFVENKTTETTSADLSFGGAIMSKGKTTNTITSCTFNGNTAMSGGAIYSCANTDDGATSDEYSKTTLTNCTFFENESTFWAGGAVENAESKLEAYYCTFTENMCGPNGAEASAIYDNAQKVITVLRNCILWNNKKVDEYDSVVSYSHGYYPSNPNVNKINRTYCVIQNSSESNPEYHIKTDDPKLQSLTDNGGFVPTIAVAAGSSTIGNGIVIDDITTDARGYIRSTTAPTIGAYEYNGTPSS